MVEKICGAFGIDPAAGRQYALLFADRVYNTHGWGSYSGVTVPLGFVFQGAIYCDRLLALISTSVITAHYLEQEILRYWRKSEFQ